eukprot:6180700-Pleurochrysis_carterae.AAC.1
MPKPEEVSSKEVKRTYKQVTSSHTGTSLAYMARRGSSYLHANEPSRLVRGLTWVAPRRGAGRRFHSAGKFGAAVGAGPLLCLEPSLQRLNPLEHCPHGALH